jgi:hypothetical protein
MIVNINHKTTIEDVQRKFSIAFPFLKIEFSDKPHKRGEQTRKGHWLDPGIRLLDIAKKPESGWIAIQPWGKTSSVEESFKENFGLFPQIFRKEGDRWIETAGTDVFTLEEQDGIGRRMVDKNHDPYWREREVLL